MSDYSIEFVDVLPAATERDVARQHQAYEADHGVVCDYTPFSVMLRNRAGKTVGALSAYSAYAEIYVDDVWIDAAYRQRGLGTKLLRALEAHYNGQGFNNINLVTNRFQAAGFYEKCGFEVEFVRENKHHPKLSKIFLVKYFGSGDQHQGTSSGAAVK